MKKINYNNTQRLFLTLLITVLFFANCKTEATSDNWSGKVTKQSECKNYSKKVNEFSNDKTYVTYKYNSTENKLILKHINTNFNCCSGDFSCQFSMQGDTLTITETADEDEVCSCMCLFDIDMEVNDIDLKTYTIKIIEPYIGDQEKISFEIDLATKPEGVFSLDRDQYPWGM